MGDLDAATDDGPPDSGSELPDPEEHRGEQCV